MRDASGLERRRVPHQLAHAANPAVVIIGFVLKIFASFRMRKDEKLFLLHGLHRVVGDLVWLESAFQQERSSGKLRLEQHVSPYALRTQIGDANYLVTISDG